MTFSCFSLSRICRVGRQNKHNLGKSCPEETLRLAAQSVPFIQVLKNTNVAKILIGPIYVQSATPLLPPSPGSRVRPAPRLHGETRVQILHRMMTRDNIYRRAASCRGLSCGGRLVTRTTTRWRWGCGNSGVNITQPPSATPR